MGSFPCILHCLFVRNFKFLFEEFIMVGVCYTLFFVLFNSHAWLLLLKCHGELILSAHLFNLFICLCLNLFCVDFVTVFVFQDIVEGKLECLICNCACPYLIQNIICSDITCITC